MGTHTSITRPARKGLLQREGLLLLLYGFAAGIAVHTFIRFFGFDTFPGEYMMNMITGSALKPYVFRRLVSDILQTLLVRSPAWLVDAASFLSSPNHLLDFNVKPVAQVTSVFFCGLAFVCFLGFAYAMRALIRNFYPSLPPAAINLAPLGALGLLPVMYRYYNHLYDPTTLVLTTVALLCLATDRCLYYAAAFAAACYNKETAVLLVPLFLLFYWQRLPRGKLIAWAAVQLAVWGGITLGIRHRFANSPVNPANPTEFHLFDHNLSLFWKVPPATLLYFLVVAAVGGWLVARGWREKPLLLRRAFLLTYVPLLFAALFYGYIDEFRAFYEAYALFFLLLLPSVLSVLGGLGEPPNET